MKVCVVGFGPAGCVVAMALSKRGHHVTVYERDPNPFDINLETLKERSYSMNSIVRGPLILEQVGLLQHFEKSRYVVPIKGIRFRGKDKSYIVHEQGFGGPRLSFMKAYLEGMRIECPQVDIRFETQISEIDMETATVNVKGKQEQYDLIIGADGVGSKVREAVCKSSDVLQMIKKTYFQRGKNLYYDRDVDPSDANYIQFFSVVPFIVGIYIRELDDKAMLGAMVVNKELSTVSQVRQYIEKASPKASSHISDEELERFLKRSAIKTGYVYANGQYYYNDKVVLIGDAIHTYPPSGQGMTLAIMGALTLSQMIQLYPENKEYAFKKYTQIQKNEAKGLQITGTSHWLPHIIMFIYFYGLGGAPHMLEKIIQDVSMGFQDIFYHYDTSTKCFVRLGQSVILSILAAFLIGGFSQIFKLVVCLLFTFSLYSVYMLQLPEIKQSFLKSPLVKGLAGLSFTFGLILYLLAYFFS